jgi:hypothetical protein
MLPFPLESVSGSLDASLPVSNLFLVLLMLPFPLESVSGSLALGICSVARLFFVFAGALLYIPAAARRALYPCSRVAGSLPPHKIETFLARSASLKVVPVLFKVVSGGGSAT